MTDTCLICLEGPQEKNALYLLNCGCRVSWFHLDCENGWIDACRYPLKCPVCRRAPGILINYSFDYSLGPDQKLLWITLGLVALQAAFFAFFSYRWIGYAICLPFQNSILLLIPSFFVTSHTMNFYLFHSRLQIVLTMVSSLWSLHMWSGHRIQRYEFFFFFNFFYLLSFLHVALVLFISVLDAYSPHIQKVNAYEPYIISCEVSHVDIQRWLPSSEAITTPTEGHETLTTSAGTLRRNQRLVRNHR
jgi:hypothetical protein